MPDTTARRMMKILNRDNVHGISVYTEQGWYHAEACTRGGLSVARTTRFDAPDKALKNLAIILHRIDLEAAE